MGRTLTSQPNKPFYQKEKDQEREHSQSVHARNLAWPPRSHYEEVTEGRRLSIQQRRQNILEGVTPCASELEQQISLTTIDDLWCEYLSALSELHAGIHWTSLAGGGRDPVQNYMKFGGFDPFREYVKKVDALFQELLTAIDSEIPKRLDAAAESVGIEPSRRGATWTYITTDQPFGIAMKQAIRQMFVKKTIR